MLSLTGSAGSGKSYLTAKITDEINMSLEENTYFYNEDLYVTALTHKAIKVTNDMLRNHGVKVESCTIQSFLNMKPIYNYETGSERFIINRFSQNKLNSPLLIVDESLIVSKELYYRSN